MPTDIDEYVRNLYRDVIAEADPDNGLGINEAEDEVTGRLIDAVRDGNITEPDWRNFIPLVFKSVDKSESSRGRRLLREITVKGPTLNLEDDPALPTVVTVRTGFRKALRHINALDLESMYDAKVENARKANDSKDEFQRRIRDPWLKCLRDNRHKTVGDALSHGDYPEWEDPSA